MTAKRSGGEERAVASYAEEVGTRLRRIRMQQGLSLQDVERRSGGKWKAAVVGSYERGDRNISAARLCELAEFYGVSPTEVLPQEDAPRPVEHAQAMVIDLSKLDTSERWSGVRRYCESIQVERGDFNRQILSVRADDLRALAVIMGTPPDTLVDVLRQEGILLDR
ncbi:MAG: transcriptional regulator [Actinomycetota bacterium]|nr:transcriptional regulator [Actinomycetota bacterium]